MKDLEPLEDWALKVVQASSRIFYVEDDGLVLARTEEDARDFASKEIGPDTEVQEMGMPTREHPGQTTWRELANTWIGFYALREAGNKLDQRDFDRMEQVETVHNLRKGFFKEYPDPVSAITGGEREMGMGNPKQSEGQTLKRRSLEAAVVEYVTGNFLEAYESL